MVTRLKQSLGQCHAAIEASVAFDSILNDASMTPCPHFQHVAAETQLTLIEMRWTSRMIQRDIFLDGRGSSAVVI